MKITIEMPNVSACEATECAYHAQGGCRARAITVGDGDHPACDTFLHSLAHTRDLFRVAGVGACKVTTCRHNDDFECQAVAIQVGRHAGHADCQTYQAR